MTGDHDRDGADVPQGERDDRPELDIDTAFAAIVAALRSQPPVEVGHWPASEDLPDGEEAARPAPDRADPADVDESAPQQLVLASPLTGPGQGRGEVMADDQGFVPPEPPPLPRGDLVSRLAWAGVLGGPLFLLVAAIAWQELPRLLLLTALAAFVGGFVTLVARLPGESGDEPDDGAVV